MTATQHRSFGQRLFWVIRTLFVIFFSAALLLLVAWGGFLGVQELQRSFGSLSTRIDANEQNLATLRTFVNEEFARGNPEIQRQLAALQESQAGTADEVGALQAALAGDMAAQADRLGALEDRLESEVQAGRDYRDALEKGLLVLQNDLNTNGSRIDALGGEIDGLRTRLDDTDTAVTSLTARADETLLGRTAVDTRQALALFRAWQLIGRARLHLLENNAGLAAADTQAALAIVDTLLAGDGGEENSPLATLQVRLALVLASLPDDPPMAIRDLETAWAETDTILTAVLGLAVETAAPTTATETLPGTETATPESAGTPTPAPATTTPTPTATP